VLRDKSSEDSKLVLSKAVTIFHVSSRGKWLLDQLCEGCPIFNHVQPMMHPSFERWCCLIRHYCRNHLILLSKLRPDETLSQPWFTGTMGYPIYLLYQMLKPKFFCGHMSTKSNMFLFLGGV
jgi:hypothetical protein